MVIRAFGRRRRWRPKRVLFDSVIKDLGTSQFRDKVVEVVNDGCGCLVKEVLMMWGFLWDSMRSGWEKDGSGHRGFLLVQWRLKGSRVLSVRGWLESESEDVNARWRFGYFLKVPRFKPRGLWIVAGKVMMANAREDE
ncbi:hypothetical protein V6N13_038689 [Hibiscus sabdariffa]